MSDTMTVTPDVLPDELGPGEAMIPDGRGPTS